MTLESPPSPLFTVAHLSDTHFRAAPGAGASGIDPDRRLGRALDRLTRSSQQIDAIVVTGDLTDNGESNAYARLRGLVEPAARHAGAAVIWVMGNHDDRRTYARELYATKSGATAVVPPQYRVHDVRGLRVIALDSSVPGYHHGDLDSPQLAWLAETLAEPAPHGTVLALHHPPLNTSSSLMDVIGLRHRERLAEVIRGSDVRAILAGHLHYATFGTFAGIPVSVTAGSSSMLDLGVASDRISQVDAPETLSLVHLYADDVSHSTVMVDAYREVDGIPPEVVHRLLSLSPDDRLEAFSRQRAAPPA